MLEVPAGLLKRYRVYHEELSGKNNVLFLKYEDVVEDFGTILDRIVGFLQLDVESGLLNKIKAEADFTVPEENIDKHKRQVRPGDFRRKLKGND